VDLLFHLVEEVALADEVLEVLFLLFAVVLAPPFLLRGFLLLLVELLVVFKVEIGVELPDLVLSVPCLLLLHDFVAVGARDARLLLPLPPEPVVELSEVNVLVDGGEDLHVVLAPGFGDLANLNFYNLGGVLAEVRPVEFGYQLLHYQAALVLYQEGLDPLLLVTTQLVRQT